MAELLAIEHHGLSCCDRTHAQNQRKVLQMTDSVGPPSSDTSGVNRPAAPGLGSGPAAMDPAAVIRSKSYLSALVLAAILGVPVSVVAYGFLVLVQQIQRQLFTDLPISLFDGAVPAWWPIPLLVLCGLCTGLTIRYLPGTGGHSPALGCAAGPRGRMVRCRREPTCRG